jgi:ADP-heptose:LPS heptosyltransferase
MSPSEAGSDAPSRIAVIKMSALGDVAKTIPTVQAIRKAYPACETMWFIRPVWADLLVGNPDVDRIVRVPRSLRGLLSAMVAIRRFCPEVVLDMQGLFTSGLIALASQSKQRYTWQSGRELSGLLTGNPIVPASPEWNVAECNFGFARLLGVEAMPTDPPEYLTTHNPFRERVRETLSTVARPVVAMHIGASAPNKQWPLSHWSALVKGLADEGWGVVILGGPGDRAVAEKVAAESGAAPLVLAGRTGLRELAAIAYECELFVGCDSGATHVAALVGTRTVCMMGATLPAHSGPFGADHRILYLGLPCSPCYRRPTCGGRYECMSGITPAMVLDACSDSMRMKRGRGSGDATSSCRTSGGSNG